ncbi:hypothetical protein IJF91_00300 [Candidatus Saccharibacteria bacterium]|nr:hypothetical protein [Candidatus Saccharibacteria bacterium]
MKTSMKRVSAAALALGLLVSNVALGGGAVSAATAHNIAFGPNVGGGTTTLGTTDDYVAFINEKRAAFDAAVNAQKTALEASYTTVTINNGNSYDDLFGSTDINNLYYNELGSVFSTDENETIYGLNTYYIDFSDDEVVNSIVVNVSLPAVGTTVNADTDEPIITLGEPDKYEVAYTQYNKGLPSEDPTYDNMAGVTFKINEGEKYYVEVYIGAKAGYRFTSDTTMTVNGVNRKEAGWGTSFYAELIAGGSSSDTSATTASTVGAPDTGSFSMEAVNSISDNSLFITVATIMIAMAGAFVVSKRFNAQEA